MFDFPPPPLPPWLKEFHCGSCDQTEKDLSELEDKFYNFVIIIVFSLSMIIILVTLSLLLHRRYKKMFKKNHQISHIADLQIENNPKFNYNSKTYNQNYYTATLPNFLLPIYESIDGHYYSDISLSSSTSTRSQDMRTTFRTPRSSPIHLPTTELQLQI